MPNVSDFTADLSRFPRWVDLDPSSFAFCETSAQINPQQQTNDRLQMRRRKA